MGIIIETVTCIRENTEDTKLLEVQKKINEIREDNKYAEIVMLFKDGVLAHWSYKQDVHY